jgi:hypothetical protein
LSTASRKPANGKTVEARDATALLEAVIGPGDWVCLCLDRYLKCIDQVADDRALPCVRRS